jgi:UDP-2,3-diacylglucosamine pyrophosphatase LpxH
MSDCHRGNGNWGDNFSDNEILFYAALKYYFNNDYTYIELGDGDELWENSKLSPIIFKHSEVFKLMAKFYKKKRFHMIYGNHDIIKRDKYISNFMLRGYFDEHSNEYVTLFPHIDINEAIILKYNDDKILLAHGHQGDFLNDTAWKLTRVLVKYIWKPLELIGIHNPASAATNDFKKISIEKKFIKWTKENKQMLIAGHTHKTMFPIVGDHLYFNDGCCTHPRNITGIEITNGAISLIKWSIKTNDDRLLVVDKQVLAGPTKLKDYFSIYY